MRTARLLARHVEFGKETDEARAWVASVDEPNARLIEASRGRADREARPDRVAAGLTGRHPLTRR